LSSEGLVAVPLDRRRFLARSGAAAAALVLGSACAPLVRRGPPAPVPAEVRLAPVRVAPDRVIRTVAGLRPYRAPGFVVRAERFDEKVVIHNYGHGGGGISLAWGSSELAVEIARTTGRRRFAVLGCGIMGLTTARLLQDAGFEATIYAKDLPPHTTSNVGGGQWSPFSVFGSGAATPAFERQYERAARLSHAYYQNLVGHRYGVRWIENFSLRSSPTLARGGALGDLFLDQRVFGPGEHPFHTPYAARFTTMIVEPNVFLPAVMDDFLLRGGRIVRREFRHLDEVLALEEDAAVNCTGIGSRALFGDEEIVPVKGELVILLPQPEVDYITLGGGGYMFPRGDGIVLGGSQRRGEWSLEPDPEVAADILEANRSVFDAMQDWRG
jgi:D-amino-acid oxidase